MPALTDARDAIWDAIDNWSGLQSGGSSIFKRTYRFDGDDSPEVKPHSGQIPALACYPDGGTIGAAKNRVWEYDKGYKFLLWTSGWDLGDSEQYELELIKALFQSDGGTGTPYIVTATGFLPQNNFQIKHTRVMADNLKVTETELLFRLRIRFNAMG